MHLFRPGGEIEQVFRLGLLQKQGDQGRGVNNEGVDQIGRPFSSYSASCSSLLLIPC